LKRILESENIEASAPCRIDMGGTLDIRTFYLPLQHLSPCTFNMAIDLRTRVRLLPYRQGFIKVSSKGFESAEFLRNEVPFDHPLGLIFSIAAFFRVEGIQIDIESDSPPRAALGGSSAAAVATVAALSKLAGLKGKRRYSRQETALLAFTLEECVLGAPCGIQDQLAAAYGGVHAWYWRINFKKPFFRKKKIIPKEAHKDLEQRLLLAYCGQPHTSTDINGRWVKQFLAGRYRDLWAEIILCTQKFIDAVFKRDFAEASKAMNRETAIRKKMTPEVLDDIGTKLVAAAGVHRCGARFTGAGGGGCIWALGEIADISELRPVWEAILATKAAARLLEVKLDSKGLGVHEEINSQF
jgi:D-glycero-alpha-D-manno-heptose-7-phosphate kinase